MAASGAWGAYYPDESAVRVFSSEISAMRHAVEHDMKVTFWPFGMSLAEAIAAKDAARVKGQDK